MTVETGQHTNETEQKRDELYDTLMELLKENTLCPYCKTRTLADVLCVAVRNIQELYGDTEALEAIGRIVGLLGINYGIESGLVVDPPEHEVRELH